MRKNNQPESCPQDADFVIGVGIQISTTFESLLLPVKKIWASDWHGFSNLCN